MKTCPFLFFVPMIEWLSIGSPPYYFRAVPKRLTHERFDYVLAPFVY